MIPREELQTLYESLAYPSALKLRRAVQLRERARAARRPQPADYEPWTISLKEARAFVQKQGQRQILAKPQPFDGKIIANLVDERWAADLIQYTSQPAEVGETRFQYVLIVQDIFTRYVWTRALKSPKAAEVRDAFRDIVQKSGRKPKELNTDKGSEFENQEFRAYLEAQSIHHLVKVGVNDIATVDAAIGALRKALTRLTATPGAGNWAQELAAATRALNESPHSHLDGEAPADATGNSEAAKSLRFDLKGKAAEDAATQDRVTQRKRERLEEAGAYREPEGHDRRGLPPRGYKPRFKTGEPVRVVSVDPLTNEVLGDGGKRARIKDVMPVPPDSTATRDPPGQGAIGDARVIRRQRAATEDVKLRVANILSTPKGLRELSNRLTPADRETLRTQKLKLRKFLELWADTFQLRGGKWATREGGASSSR